MQTCYHFLYFEIYYSIQSEMTYPHKAFTTQKVLYEINLSWGFHEIGDKKNKD